MKGPTYFTAFDAILLAVLIGIAAAVVLAVFSPKPAHAADVLIAEVPVEKRRVGWLNPDRFSLSLGSGARLDRLPNETVAFGDAQLNYAASDGIQLRVRTILDLGDMKGKPGWEARAAWVLF